MVKIKKVGILSFAKVIGIIYAVMGLLIGAAISIVAAIYYVKFGNVVGWGVQQILQLGAIIVYPIFYGVMGFIGGALGSFVYNLVSRYVGGIQIELVEVEKVHHHHTSVEEK